MIAKSAPLNAIDPANRVQFSLSKNLCCRRSTVGMLVTAADASAEGIGASGRGPCAKTVRENVVLAKIAAVTRRMRNR